MKRFQLFCEENQNYTLELQDDRTVLVVRTNLSKKWIEIRGKRGYETKSYDSKDPLHKFLDTLDPATVSNLFAGETISINPKNKRSKPSIEAIQKLMKER